MLNLEYFTIFLLAPIDDISSSSQTKKHWLSSVFISSSAPCRNRTCNYSL